MNKEINRIINVVFVFPYSKSFEEFFELKSLNVSLKYSMGNVYIKANKKPLELFTNDFKMMNNYLLHQSFQLMFALNKQKNKYV